MKILVQCAGGWGRVQREVKISELHHHEDVYIAIHLPLDRYDYWVATDLVTGQIIEKSLSKKLALIKAKKRIEKHKEIFQKAQFKELKKLFNSSSPVDFKLKERIERKCIARGTTSIKTVKIVGEFMDEIYFQQST